MRILWCSFMVAGCALALSGASTSIGVVRSYGDFKVDGATVRGNGTLLAGDILESTNISTTANVGKAELTLSPSSRVAVYKDHTTVQRGTTTVRGSSHTLEAGVLRVVPTAAHSLVEVGYSDRKVITISAHAGAADVFTTSGQLLASLNAGGVLAFEPSSGNGHSPSSGLGQGQAETSVQLNGTLTSSEGKYYLTQGGKRYQVTSSTIDLSKYVGKVVEGSASIVSTTADVTVVAINTVTVAAVAAGAGLSTGLIVAVAAGIGAAGVVGGLAASGAIGSGSSSTP